MLWPRPAGCGSSDPSRPRAERRRWSHATEACAGTHVIMKAASRRSCFVEASRQSALSWRWSIALPVSPMLRRGVSRPLSTARGMGWSSCHACADAEGMRKPAECTCESTAARGASTEKLRGVALLPSGSLMTSCTTPVPAAGSSPGARCAQKASSTAGSTAGSAGGRSAAAACGAEPVAPVRAGMLASRASSAGAGPDAAAAAVAST
mmetsp:Transcript_2074/g.5829  ORF Transcript_2074/g.5829 Transcript_2074/m.5829 type:complete len:208 (+) Transcript_2074:2582-3205(+)